MHYLQYGTGLQTWEYSPLYAIRSWAYILLHTLAAEIARLAMSANRVSIVIIFVCRDGPSLPFCVHGGYTNGVSGRVDFLCANYAFPSPAPSIFYHQDHSGRNIGTL